VPEAGPDVLGAAKKKKKKEGRGVLGDSYWLTGPHEQGGKILLGVWRFPASLAAPTLRLKGCWRVYADAQIEVAF